MANVRWEYVCIYALICLFQSVKGEYAYVTFDPSLEGLDQCILPSNVKLTLEVGGETLTLNLRRNDHVHPGVPSYVIEMTADGRTGFRREEQDDPKLRAAYQDLAHEAAVFITCAVSPSGAEYEMEGSLFVGSVKYRVLPSQSTVPLYRRLFHSGAEKLYHVIRAKEDLPFDAEITVEKYEEIISRSLDEIRLPPARAAREKREVVDAEQTINIDVIALLDYSLLKVWTAREGGDAARGKTEMKKYFAHVMNSVSLRFKSIGELNTGNTNHLFNIRLVGFFIPTNETDSPWSEKIRGHITTNNTWQLNATVVLEALKTWSASTPDVPAHDHIMMFTSYDLVTDDNGFRFNYTTGFAYVATTCATDGSSVSVVEDQGGYQSVGTAAHELGHSLGARHDGSNNTCSSADRYVMAPTSHDESPSNKYNPWYFSACSVQYFVDYINTATTADPNKTACFTETLPGVDIPNITGEMPGQLLPPDAQCQQQFGNTSYLCRGVDFDVTNIICRAMFCYMPSTVKCQMLTAAMGTTCGNKKWCINGECITSDSAPAVDDACPHGDQPYVRTAGGNELCPDMLATQSGLCYSAEWNSTCCGSCKIICQGEAGCECGDRVKGCNRESCGAYNETTRQSCCKTCADYTTSTTSTTTTTTTSPTTTVSSTSTVTYPTTCTDVSSFGGRSCAEHVQDVGRQSCYDAHVNRSCCESCENKKMSQSAGCEWGDYYPNSCTILKSLPNGAICPSNSSLNILCCNSCLQLQKAVDIAVIKTTPVLSGSIPPSPAYWLIAVCCIYSILRLISNS